MEREKIALGALVIIIVAVLSFYLISSEGLLDDIFSGEEKETIEFGDCADIHFIGKYSSNDEIFSSSYADPENQEGGTPINVFVSNDMNETPPQNYSSYRSSALMSQSIEEYLALSKSPVGIKEGFMEKLVGMGTNDIGKKIKLELSPKQAFGINPEVGDLLNLTPVAQIPLEYKIINIRENAEVPEEYLTVYGDILGNKTTMYTLRDNLRKIGEIVDDKYTSWDNSTVVTKINETMIWMYTTPSESYIEGKNFTWTSFNSTTSTRRVFPVNSSKITSIDNDTIIVTHNPEYNDTITESVYYAQYDMYIPSIEYTVESVTGDKINVSYVNSQTSEKTYTTLDRTVVIQRNETQTITEEYPAEILEIQLYSIREMSSDFYYGCGELAGEEISFEFVIEEIYKTS